MSHSAWKQASGWHVRDLFSFMDCITYIEENKRSEMFVIHVGTSMQRNLILSLQDLVQMPNTSSREDIEKLALVVLSAISDKNNTAYG